MFSTQKSLLFKKNNRIRAKKLFFEPTLTIFFLQLHPYEAENDVKDTGNKSTIMLRVFDTEHESADIIWQTKCKQIHRQRESLSWLRIRSTITSLTLWRCF